MAQTLRGNAGTSRTFCWLWVVFFLQGMAPGFWTPALTNILSARGLGSWVAVVFAVIPCCSLISPVIGGALADRHLPANRLFAWISFLGAGALWLAFWGLDRQWNPLWFVALIGLYSLILAPAWGLLATVALSHMTHTERQYPLVRMGGTIGWMAAGFLTSYALRADASPVAGYAGVAVKALTGLCAFRLPHTPPVPRQHGWKDWLGVDAFRLLRQRDHLVFFGVTAMASIPLSAFYMYAPEQLRQMGVRHPTATMSVAQWSEILAMLVMGALMVRFRLKVLILAALGGSVLRYGMSGYAGYAGAVGWHVAGIALYGICYALLFVAPQVFLDRRVPAHMKNQAQGLLLLVSGGIGPLAGSLVCGLLREWWVDDQGRGWAPFWASLSGMLGLCFVMFLFCYRGSPQAETGAGKSPAG